MIAALFRRDEPELRDAQRHSRALAARLLATTALGAGAMALLWHWPAPRNYAAPGRLTIVCALLALVAVGVPAVVRQFRRWRAAALAARVAAAPAAIRETALFLQAEADLAWRGIPALLFAGFAGGGLWILAHWPQAAALAPLQPLLAGVALGAGPLLVVQLVRRRRHLINVAYLRWCLNARRGPADRQAGPGSEGRLPRQARTPLRPSRPQRRPADPRSRRLGHPWQHGGEHPLEPARQRRRRP